MIFFWPAFFLPTFFRWLLHTFLPRFPYFFCHVRKKNFFSPLFFPPPTTPIMFYLPECQFYISLHFWISKFPDLINSLPPPSFVALPSTTICLLLHQLTVHFAIDYWIFTQNSQLIWQQLTHWLLKLQVVFLIILQPASTAASTTPNAVHVATISTTAISHELFNFASCHWTATTSKHNSCCNNFYNYDWLLIVQPANTTAFTIYVAFPTTISSLLLNTQIQHLAQHPPQFVLHFPLK